MKYIYYKRRDKIPDNLKIEDGVDQFSWSEEKPEWHFTKGWTGKPIRSLFAHDIALFRKAVKKKKIG